VKSVSDKWEKLRSQYYKVKNANNNLGVGATKFIWYDAIDEILSHTAKANGVSGTMDQGEYVRGIAALPMNLEDEGVGDGEPAWTRSPDRTVPAFTCTGNGETRSTAAPHLIHMPPTLLDVEVKVLLRVQNVQKLIET
jgi:hypothetical protein